MERKFLAGLLSFCMALSLLPGTAHAAAAVAGGSCGKNVTWTLDNGKLTISGTGEMENYSGEHVWQGEITKVDTPWSGRGSITSAVIEEGVTSIGKSAFCGCTDMTSVKIASSVTKIYQDAFYGCLSLESVTIPEGVSYIDYNAFFNCQGLVRAEIPKSVTTIMGGAFGTYDRVEALTLHYAGNPDDWNSLFINYTYDNENTEYEYPGENVYGMAAIGYVLAPEKYPGGDRVTFSPEVARTPDMILEDDENPAVTITSDTAFKADLTVGGMQIDPASTGLVPEALTLSPDRKTLTLSFARPSRDGGQLSITVPGDMFSVPVESACVLSPIEVIGVMVDPDPPAPDPPVTDPSGPVFPAPAPDPLPVPAEPERPDEGEDPGQTGEPAGDPVEDVEVALPAPELLPPPEDEPVSPIQDSVKRPDDGPGGSPDGGSAWVDWEERLDLPGYAQDLCAALAEGAAPGGTGEALAADENFTLTDRIPASSVDYDVEAVEQADFSLARTYDGAGGKEGEEDSLGRASFDDEDFYAVSADPGDRKVDYRALRTGDMVRIPSFNGIFVTSVTQGEDFDRQKKDTCAYISAVYQAFEMDHPEVFWLSGKCRVRMMSLKNADGGKETYFFLVLADQDGFDMRSPDWRAPGAVADGIARREAAVERILGTVDAETEDGKLRQLNRRLTEQNEYNTTPDLTTIGNEPHECLSALEGRVGTEGPVCDGYSRAFKVLCDRLGISCILETGYARSRPGSEGSFHMWNAVELAGTWYGADVTWNDPVVKGVTGARSGKEHDQFLLVGSDTEVWGMDFASSHPAINKAARDGVAFDNGPTLSAVAFAAVTANAGLAALPFADVPAGAWYYGAVAYVYENELMAGETDASFAPEGAMTRAMVWTVLARMAGEDVSGGDPWYAGAQSWAMGGNISDGANPGGRITREELVTMLWRAEGSPAAEADLDGFSDGGMVSDWAEAAVRWAVSAGVLKGSGGKLNPGGAATRAETAALLELCRTRRK